MCPIFPPKCIESAATAADMIAQFHKRMAKNCPQVSSHNLEVRLRRTATTSAGTPGGAVQTGTETISMNM